MVAIIVSITGIAVAVLVITVVTVISTKNFI
jgi:hypothetical protein